MIDIELIKAERARRSLSEFIKQAWHVVEPATQYIHGWHIDAISDHLTALRHGQIRNLLINMPPRHAKPVSIQSMILEKQKGRVQLKDISVGDEVLTHRGRFRKVIAVHEQGILPLLEIAVHSGRKLRLAYEHPLLTPTGWKQAQHITTNDTLAEIHAQSECGQKTISNEEARLIGYLVGDGSVKYQTATFTNCDPDTIADFEHCAKTMGFRTRIKRIPPSAINKMPKASLIVLLPTCKEGKTKWHVSTSGPHPVWTFLEKHNLKGKCSYDKRVPDAVMSGTSETIAHYLGAYWACDGSIGKKATKFARKERAYKEQFRKDIRCSATTVCEGLAFDHQHLLTRLGITSRVRIKRAQLKTRIQGDIYLSYNVELGTQNQIAKFGKIVPIYHSKLKNLIDYNRADFDRIISPDKVIAITAIEPGECRCLTVEEDSSFTIEDIAVHNSLLCGVFFPAWYWIDRPDIRWLFASYAQPLSTRDSVKCRRLIQSPWYKKNFGHIYQLTGDQNQKTRFENTKQGYRLATSVDGGATGEGGDIIAVDDPHNVREAESQATRENTLTWWDEAMSTRGNDPKTFAKLIVMQRVNALDLSGHVLAQGGYEHLCLPAEYEGCKKITSIGWSDPRIEDGELLWPERFDREAIDGLKKVLNIYGTAGQLQQRPTPREGGIFELKWLEKTYRELPKLVYVIQSWDTAFKVKKTNDYSACITIGVGADKNFYVLHVFKERLKYPDLKRMMVKLFKQFSPMKILIEDKGSGQSLGQEMLLPVLDDVFDGEDGKNKVFHKLPIKLIEPDGDKVARANACTTIVDINLFLPEHADWKQDYLDSMTAFPNGAHDDDVDATTQVLIHLAVNTRARAPAMANINVFGR